MRDGRAASLNDIKRNFQSFRIEDYDKYCAPIAQPVFVASNNLMEMPIVERDV